MNRLVPLALAAGLAGACGSPAPPPRRAPPPAPPAPKMIEDDDRPKSPANIYVYSPIGKRDPFANQLANVGISHIEVKGHIKTALEKWSLDQLKLSLTVTGTATPVAMVEDPDHRGWTVHLGDFIGQNGGKVTGIHRSEIIVTETITDHSTGRVYPQNVKLAVEVSKDEESDLRNLQEGETLGLSRGER